MSVSEMSWTTSTETTPSSSTLSTPQSSGRDTPLPEEVPSGHSTPKSTKQWDRGMMLPPPVPATSIVAPTPYVFLTLDSTLNNMVRLM